MRILGPLLLLCILSVPPAMAVPSREIVILGNHVYDDETILYESGISYGGEALSNEEIRKRLVETGFFSWVRVQENRGRTVITVSEKSPNFVLPYFFTASDRNVFGVAAGFLGVDEGASRLLARYQLGKGDHEGGVFYLKDFAFSTFGLISGTLDYESALHDLHQGERTVTGTYGNWQVNTAFGLGYHINSEVLFQLDAHLEWHKFEETNGSERKGTLVSHRLFAEIGTLYSDEGLVSGYRLKPYAEISNPASSFTFRQWGIKAEASAYRRGSFNWIVRPRWEAGEGLPRFQLFELGGPRLRGYPSQMFRSDHYSILQNDVFLFSTTLWSKLILRPFLFADLAYIEGGGRPSAGLGFSAYFPHISIPAIQIAAGFGSRPAGFSIAAAIGPQP